MRRSFTPEFKQGIVKKILLPGGPSIPEMARELGIDDPTIRRWVKKHGKTGVMSKTGSWSPADKLRILNETSILSEGELGAYLRKHGLHTEGNKLSSEERLNVIRVANSSKYMDLPPSQIVPLLADEGNYICSESTFYRILKLESLLAPRGKRKKASHKIPMGLIATGPNQAYSWDITYLRSALRGTFFYLYMFVDIWSRKIVGWEVHESEDMIKSSLLISRIYSDENLKPGQVKLHSDNGGPMKGATMLATL